MAFLVLLVVLVSADLPEVAFEGGVTTGGVELRLEGFLVGGDGVRSNAVIDLQIQRKITAFLRHDQISASANSIKMEKR